MSNNSTLMHLRPRNPHRAPLAPIHLSHLPSPTSLPTKRNAVAGPSETSKMRKVSTYPEKEGVETIKRSRAGKKEVTPRAKRFLETDEIGTGKSPARRLFTSDQSYGIAGAVLTPTSSRRSLSPSPASPSRSFSLHDDDDNDERESPLDLSIPIHENGINIHDPGFIIFNETHIASTSTTRYTPPTPDSTRFTSIPNLAPDAMAHIPSSPGSVMSYHTGYGDENGDEEDQENIPPPSMTSFTFGTPSKGRFLMSPTSAGKGPGSESRQRRIMERSKLGLNSVIGKGDDERQEEGDDLVDGEGGGGEELTPGRRQTRRDVSSARRALLREVNRI